MKLLAEAGGTKIAWVLKSSDKTIDFKTVGYNPLANDSNLLRQMLISGFPSSVNPNEVDSIQYFGSGCATAFGQERVRKALQHFFVNSQSIAIYSDLEAVGLSLFGTNKNGIVGILGTGASAGYYNNGKLDMPVPSLGYLLGDEGSGAYLGKALVQKVLRGGIDEGLQHAFLSTFQLKREDIINKVYQSKQPARMLASFVPFLKEHLQNDVFNTMVKEAFVQYIAINIVPIATKYPNSKIGLVGGVAASFSEILAPLLEECLSTEVIIKHSPLAGLLKLE